MNTLARQALALGPHPIWAATLSHQQGLAAEAQRDRKAATEAYRRSIDVLDEVLSDLGLSDLVSWLTSVQRPAVEALFALQADAGDTLGAVATLERARSAAFLRAFEGSTRSTVTVGDALAVADEGQTRLDTLESVLALIPAMSGRVVGRRLSTPALLSALGSQRVLAYLRVREHVFVACVCGGTAPRVQRLQASGEDVKKLAERLAADPDDASAAAALGAALLPEELLPPDGAPVWIVADDALGLERVPFAALRRGDRYLVERTPVAYVPSLHALATLGGLPRQTPGASIVLGDARGDLPAAGAEARDVAALLGGRARVGPEATLEAVKAARQADVLHVAAHARGGPRGDALALADGELTTEGVLRSRIAPRLVVLASCSSGAAGHGSASASLAQAFLAAGSPAVLATLRSVDDAQARDFVLAFYREGGAADALHALARVQRRRIAAGEPPSRWAAFALFGAGN